MLGAVDLVQPAAAPQLFESGTVDMLSSDPAKVVVSAIGSYSCADVWVSRPAGTSTRHMLNLFGRVGDARVLLASIDPSELTYTTDDAREGAIALSVRGRPCSALEVEVDPGDAVSGVQVFLQAWHADIPPEAITGPERAVTVEQGQAATDGGRWPVYLSTGSVAQGAVNTPLFVRLSDGTAALGSTANPIRSDRARTAYPTFSVGSDRVLTVSTAIAAGNAVSLGTLWHPSANTKRVELRRVVVSYFGANTAGVIRLRGARLTGVTAPSGGIGITPLAHDISDLPSSPAVTFMVNASSVPGRSLTDFFMAMIKTSEGTFEWSAGEDGKPIVLRASQSEGFEVRAHVETQLVTNPMTFGVYVQWIEI